MTSVMLCTAVAVLGSALIYVFKSQKPFFMRVQYAVFSVFTCGFALVCAPIYDDLTDYNIFSKFDGYKQIYETDVEIGKFELSDTYGIIFMIILCVISFLPPVIYAMGQAFGRTKPKYTHFWGIFTLYVMLSTGVFLDCFFINEKFSYLLIFMPMFAVLFVVMLASVMLNISDLKQFITALVIGVLICGGTLVWFVVGVITDPAGFVVTIGTVVMTVFLLAFTAAGVVFPILARRNLKKGEAK